MCYNGTFSPVSRTRECFFLVTKKLLINLLKSNSIILCQQAARCDISLHSKEVNTRCSVRIIANIDKFCFGFNSSQHAYDIYIYI